MEPVRLESGDCVEIRLDAILTNERYIWRWRTLVRDAAGTETKVQFDQSTFHANAVTKETLRMRSPAHVPALGEEGLVDRFILEQMDGRNASSAIAKAASSEFPHKFPTPTQAMGRIGHLSAKYSR